MTTWAGFGMRCESGWTDRVALVTLFFFSSRRRHTRSLRDWSSDVCSSDLLAITEPVTGGGSRQLIPRLVLDFPLRRDNSVVFVAAKAIFPSSSLRRHDDPVGTVVDVTEHPITGTFREWHDLENRFAAMRNDQPLPALLDLLEILERVRFESGFGNRVFCH